MFNLFKSRSIVTTSVRYFSPRNQPHDTGTYRGEKIVRYGYEAHHHEKGLLPRLKIKESHLKTMPMTSKEDPWSERLSRMGENDLIRLFGDEDVHQSDLLTHIPEWLRGYDARREYSVLMLRRKEFEHWKFEEPLRWKHLEQRMKFLYRRINNKYMPPGVEKLKRSRYVI